jgi:hypothetical protein
LIKGETYLAVLRDSSATYAKQPYGKKNAFQAVIAALDRHNVQESAMRRAMLSEVCRTLGKAGGKASAISRNQYNLFKK